jgi:hypothetical protein
MSPAVFSAPVAAQDFAPAAVTSTSEAVAAPAERAVPAPVAVAPAPIAAAPVALAPMFVHVAPAPVDQIIDEQPSAPRQPRQRPRPSEDSIENTPLVFIETAADKLQSVQATVEEEEAPRRRTPRPRKPRDTVSEPLVFVETQPTGKPDQPAP